MCAFVFQRTLLFLLLPLVLLILHVFLPMHVLHLLVGVVGACVTADTTSMLLQSAIVVVACVAAFVGSTALCAVLFPMACCGCWCSIGVAALQRLCQMLCS